MGLLGSGSSGKRGKARLPKLQDTPNVETDPSKSGNPDQVAQRTNMALQGVMLKNINRKSKSSGLKIGRR